MKLLQAIHLAYGTYLENLQMDSLMDTMSAGFWSSLKRETNLTVS